ncbi:MAG: type II toxin-antitoxin system VapC family toxin [Deltaproteobacteria bacterium]|nr:type II toxin-antitoxin system VapC family toxin [Deltaproteobacteria bacterium]
MRLLIDTQCWLWMSTAPSRFRPETLATLLDPDTERLLSAASAWEIAIKYALGKLPLPEAPAAYVPSRMRTTCTKGLVVKHRHALHVATLAVHHRDPFDRLIIAQAQVEDLQVLTADPQFEQYGVRLLAP